MSQQLMYLQAEVSIYFHDLFHPLKTLSLQTLLGDGVCVCVWLQILRREAELPLSIKKRSPERYRSYPLDSILYPPPSQSHSQLHEQPCVS